MQKMSARDGGVFAVVVSFHPDLSVLGRLLDALQHQVNGIVVVDNGSPATFQEWLKSFHVSIPLRLLALGENRGIASAQNVGIDYAREQGAEFVILFDHDSNPAPDMVARLLAVVEAKRLEGVAVGGVGPRYLDERQDNPPPFIQVNGLRVERQPCCSDDSVVEVSYLIASGCLIPLRTLEVVGNMHEELFIDYVDIEWGLRAASKGFTSFGACGAKMAHDLGDEPIRFMGKSYPQHSPLRHYYHFRNAVWLYRRNWVPFNWKVADGWRLLLKYGFYTLFAKPRYRQWLMMSKGVWHGVTGKMGQLK